MKLIVQLRILCLCLLVFFFQDHKVSGQCRDDQQEALLELKNGFFKFSPSTGFATWRLDVDCCKWEGIICSKNTGKVVSLDISESCIMGDGVSSEILISLNKLSSLEYLNLENCGFSGDFPEEVFSFKNLTDLDISGNQDLKIVIPELPKNSVLRSLKLSYTNLSWTSAASLSKLYSLTTLDVASCDDVSGPLPFWISTLKNLAYLYMSDNNLEGDIGLLQNLTKLVHLDLSENIFTGSVSLQNLTKLVDLDLSLNNFTGHIRLQNLPELVDLDLSVNNFSGSMPSFSSIQNLNVIDLSSNRLEGEIPRSYGNLSKLYDLSAGNNLIEGSLPSLFFHHPSLNTLYLPNNNLNRLPKEMNMTSSKLSFLDLESNHLTGPIPKCIFQLKNLQFLNLAHNNFNGTLDLQLFSNLQNLRRLYLSGNDLLLINPSSNFTSHYFPKFDILKLSSCKLNEFPSFLRSNGRLYDLDLSENNISGKIPNWIWNAMGSSVNSLLLNLSYNLLEGFEEPHYNKSSMNFSSLDLSHNKLSGPISEILGANFEKALFITVANNRFFGKIPETICNAKWLLSFDLSHNELNGTIPQCIGELGARLSILNLEHNKFHGKIPQIYGKYCSLRILNLNGNQLEGDIPRSVENCKRLQVLDLGNNQLSGTFPFWLGSLTDLRVLVTRSNRFYGGINFTYTNHSFPSLNIMDISSNNFTGTISLNYLQRLKAPNTNDDQTDIRDFYYRVSVTLVTKGEERVIPKIILNVFSSVDLSNNNFQGEIPKDIGKLKSLRLLNISRNLLTGLIPPSIGNLTLLESLDLSINSLSGLIPVELTSLTFLSMLNLSMNDLEGRIPEGKQFNTFNEKSFLGNPRLCGQPLPTKCSKNSRPYVSPEKGTSRSVIEISWFTFPFAFVSGLIIGILVGNIVRTRGSKLKSINRR